MNISSFLIGYQAGKKAGGGSSADVRYVTFMSDDGTEELGRIPVAAGYDCPTPKFTATKESTAQFHFTHDYWATEPNGATDPNALKAVTEDRVVYATYISVLRSYSITFYDGDTVLDSKEWAYGSTPSYPATKVGYDFVAWEPAVVPVTGEASYTATWKQKAAFGTATWAEISAITTAGESAGTFSVGDKRDEVLTYSDGTKENIELVIAHIFDDGRLVLALNHALATTKQMNASLNQNSYYNNLDLHKYVTDTVYPALSESLRAVTRPSWNNDEHISLVTQSNCGGKMEQLDYSLSYDTPWKALDLFVTQSNRIRHLGKNGTTATTYWLRTPYKSGAYYYFKWIDTAGAVKASSGAQAGLYDKRAVVFLLVV